MVTFCMLFYCMLEVPDHNFTSENLLYTPIDLQLLKIDKNTFLNVIFDWPIFTTDFFLLSIGVNPNKLYMYGWGLA